MIIAENDIIEGMTIIDGDGYWNKNNVFQIVYLDSIDVSSLYDLIGFAMMLLQSAHDRYKRIQIFAPQTSQISSVIRELNIINPDEFLLYGKPI